MREDELFGSVDWFLAAKVCDSGAGSSIRSVSVGWLCGVNARDLGVDRGLVLSVVAGTTPPPPAQPATKIPNTTILHRNRVFNFFTSAGFFVKTICLP